VPVTVPEYGRAVVGLGAVDVVAVPVLLLDDVAGLLLDEEHAPSAVARRTSPTLARRTFLYRGVPAPAVAAARGTVALLVGRLMVTIGSFLSGRPFALGPLGSDQWDADENGGPGVAGGPRPETQVASAAVRRISSSLSVQAR